MLKSIREILQRRKIYYWIVAMIYGLYNGFFTHIPNHWIRTTYLKCLLRVKFGKKSYIGGGQTITGYHSGTTIRIGNYTVINRNCYLDGRSGIFIGNNVNISFGSTLITLQHDYNSADFCCQAGSIIIEDYVWIGAKATILPGITIGQGAVVAAGAVVARNVAPYTVVGGVPAKPISYRNKELTYNNNFSPLFNTDISDDSKFYKNINKSIPADDIVRKKSIALITLAPLIPVDSGGKLATANAVLPLTEEYDYHLFSFYDPSDTSYNVNKTLYDTHFKSVTLVPNPKMLHELTATGKIIHVLKHIFLNLPLFDISFYSHEMVKSVKSFSKYSNIDLIEAHNLHCAYLKHFLPKIPMMLVNQNIEGDLFPFWEPHTNSKLRAFVWHNIAKISRRNTYNIEIGNKYKIESKVFISKEDMVQVNQVKSYCELIPISFKAKKEQRAHSDGKTHVLWVGGFSWYPNEEGMRWFISHVYPMLSDREDMVFHIVGGAPFQELKKLHKLGKFEVTGRVEDLSPLFAISDILICPIFSASGVRIKILEAMSKGLAVVATTKGAQGVGASHMDSLLITDDSATYADYLVQLATNKPLINELSKNALSYIENEHNISRSLFLKRRAYGRIVK